MLQHTVETFKWDERRKVVKKEAKGKNIMLLVSNGIFGIEMR